LQYIQKAHTFEYKPFNQSLQPIAVRIAKSDFVKISKNTNEISEFESLILAPRVILLSPKMYTTSFYE